MNTDDQLLVQLIKENPEHPILKKALVEYKTILYRVKGSRGAMFRSNEEEPLIVFTDEHGKTMAIVGIDSWKKLEDKNRSMTTTGMLEPSKYLLEFVRSRAREEPAVDLTVSRSGDGQGRVRTISSKGGPVMTTQSRVTDLLLNRAFDPNSYLPDGRHIGRDFSRSLGNSVSVAGKRSVQLTMFPKSMASMKSGDFEFEVRRTPISDGLLFFGHREPPTNKEAWDAADAVISDGGHIYKLVALAHSLDGWTPWTDEIADRFHWHRPPSDTHDRSRRNAFRYFEIARCFLLRHRKVWKYPIPLIDTKPGNPSEPHWSVRRPWIFDDAHRRINLQSRPTGALYRMPRRKHDPIPLMYSVGEAILQSGPGVDRENRMPVLVDSKDGTGWQDVLLFWALCGRPIPNDVKGRVQARKYISRRLKDLINLQETERSPETVRFDFDPGNGHSRPAQFKVVATDEFRQAHLSDREFEVWETEGIYSSMTGKESPVC